MAINLKKKTLPALPVEPEKSSKSEQLLAIADRIKKRNGDYVVATGNDLLEAKAIIGHGGFTTWLKKNFDWSLSHANNFMNAAKAAAENPIIGKLKPSALIALAATNTPESVKSEVIAEIGAGSVPTPKAVKAKIAAAKLTSALKTTAIKSNATEHETEGEPVHHDLVQRLKAVGFEAAENAFETAYPGAVIARGEEVVVQASL